MSQPQPGQCYKGDMDTLYFLIGYDVILIIISHVVVGAISVGIMSAAFESALSFSKSDARGGAEPIFGRQSVADLLMGVKMRIDASRFLTWKACHALDNGLGGELALEAKIYCSDLAVKSVMDCNSAVGM